MRVYPELALTRASFLYQLPWCALVLASWILAVRDMVANVAKGGLLPARMLIDARLWNLLATLEGITNLCHRSHLLSLAPLPYQRSGEESRGEVTHLA